LVKYFLKTKVRIADSSLKNWSQKDWWLKMKKRQPHLGIKLYFKIESPIKGNERCGLILKNSSSTASVHHRKNYI
jgi:hypothetical protein